MDEFYQKQLLDTLGVSIFIKDCDGRYIYVNQKVCDLFNLRREEIVGKRDSELFDGDIARLIEFNDVHVLNQRATVKNKECQYFPMRDEYYHYLSFKTPMFDDDNKLLGLCGVSIDISEDEVEKIMLEKQAIFDFVTNSFNRRYLEQEIEKEISRSKRYKSALSVLILDLDYFKKINDNFGHTVGDRVLKVISQSIQANIRKEDTLCRYGGDEFCVLLPQASARKSFLISEKLRKKITSINFISFKGERIPISCSIGVATLCGNDTRDSLIDNADFALYFAKEFGRNTSFVQCPLLKSVMRCSECDQTCEL